MFTQSTSRKGLKIAVLALAVSAFTFTTIPSAQAGGFSFMMDGEHQTEGDGGNMDGAAIGALVTIGVIAAIVATHKKQDQKYYDNNWAALQAEDAKIHAEEYSLATQKRHDCNYLAKLRALIQEMYHNLEHYQNDFAKGPNRTAAIADEKASINNLEAQLPAAEAACEGK